MLLPFLISNPHMQEILLPRPPQELRFQASVAGPHLPYRLFNVLPPEKSFKPVTLKPGTFPQERWAVK